jgi:hypothetical protein
VVKPIVKHLFSKLTNLLWLVTPFGLLFKELAKIFFGSDLNLSTEFGPKNYQNQKLNLLGPWQMLIGSAGFQFGRSDQLQIYLVRSDLTHISPLLDSSKTRGGRTRPDPRNLPGPEPNPNPTQSNFLRKSNLTRPDPRSNCL